MEISSKLASLAKRKLPAVGGEFEGLIRSIGESKSKSEEDAIVMRMVEISKQQIKEGLSRKDANSRSLKELLVFLVYIDMLGHDTSWARATVIQLCSNKSLVVKKTAYLATSLLVDPASELNIMVTATIQADLKSDNFLVVCTALQAICRCAGPELISVFLPQVLSLLRHDRDLVKKKALLALQRFVQLDPSTAPDLERHLVEKLGYKEPSVMVAALCGLQDLVRADPAPYRNLAHYFTNILKQAAEGKLGRSWDYHRAPAPFVQIQLLRLLAALGAGDAAASANMTAVIAEVWRRTEPLASNVGNAIVLECVRTAAAIHPSDQLLSLALASAARFLSAKDNNQRYAGIDALARLVAGDAGRVAQHQYAVVECLRSPDATLKRKTLDLLFKMAGPANIEVVAREALAYLKEGGGGDEAARRHAAQQLCDSAERLAPSLRWYVDTLTEVLAAAGGAVPGSAANALMRVVTEGSGGEDDEGDAELRRGVAGEYLALLDRPKLPPELLRVACWMVGEFGLTTGEEYEALADRVAGVAESQGRCGEVASCVVGALGKLALRAGRPLPSEAAAFLDAAARSESAELQQQAVEVQALLRASPATQRAALPGASPAHAVAVDAGLAFLDDFVQRAAAAGAAPHLGLQERIAMGVTTDPDAALAPALHHQGALKFEAYEVGRAPAPLPAFPAAAGQPPVSAAPVFDDLDLMGLSLSQSPSPSAAPPPRAVAASPPPARPAEPSLLISRSGRKWGPAAGEAAAPPAAAPHRTQPLTQSPAQRGEERRQAQPPPPLDPAKQQLAASLFGNGSGASGSSGGRAAGIRRPGPRTSAPQSLEVDLLGDALPAGGAGGDAGAGLLLGRVGLAPQQAQQAVSDPMAALAGLEVAGAAPGACGGASSPEMLEELDFLGTPSVHQPQAAPGNSTAAPQRAPASQPRAKQANPFTDLLG